MGRRSINTTKSGKYMNPTDQFRKEARKRELKKNKKQRIMVRTAVLKGKDPMKLLEEMEIIDRMEYDPMQPPSLNEKVLREKRKKLKETYDRVFKLYEKERPDYAVDLKKANIEYEKTRAQLQQHFDQVRNAERVQLDQIPLPDAPVDMGVPGVIPLPMEMEIPLQIAGMPMPMNVMPPPSILKKTSAYGPPVGIGPHIPIHSQSEKKKKPAGPPPGPPPDLSDSEEEEQEAEQADEEYDPEKGIIEDLGDVDMRTELASMRQESQGKSRRIRFADDDDDEEDDEEEEEAHLSDDERRREREERRRRRRERRKRRQEEKDKEKSKKKVSALQAMMLQMAGQNVPEYQKEGKSSSSESSDSSQTSESDDDDRRRRRHADRREDERIRNKEREIARRREEISRLDDRPPGVDDQGDNRLSETETAAMVAARLAEEAEMEAESRHLSTGSTKVPPGPPPGLPPNIGGPQGLPPGPPPGAPPMFLRPPPMRGGPPGAPPRLMPPGPPPGRPQGMPPGPPPGLPPSLRSSLMRIPTPLGVPPPRGMLRPPGPMGMHLPSIPPPQGINPNILSAPPSIRPRDGEEGGAGGPVGAGGGGPSRVTIQAKPQIKSKMGDVTRFMPMSLKVKRETRDQKGRIRQANKEEEPRVIGAQAKPQPVPAAQAKTKDDAYDQFMKEMEGLI